MPAPILTEADSLTSTSRKAAYGDAASNFQNIADILRVLVRARYGVDISFTADFVSLLMAVAVKGAREAFKPGHDNRLDAIGYMTLAEQILVQQAKKESDDEHK